MGIITTVLAGVLLLIVLIAAIPTGPNDPVNDLALLTAVVISLIFGLGCLLIHED